jgi:hypothetical protein
VLVRSEEPGASTRLASGLDEFQRDLGVSGSQAETWFAPPDAADFAAASPDGAVAEREPIGPHPILEQRNGPMREQFGGNQRGRGALPEWVELLSERADETALRRLRSETQKGNDTWRQ